MSETPWRSIGEGLVPLDSNPLAYHEAKQSPCATCATTPCCTFVPVHKFRVAGIRDLDHARYLLNFEHIEITLAADGVWTVYYRYPCRYLDRAKHSCTIYDQPERPRVCANYDPYTCWYKEVFTQSATPEYVRLDRRRLDVFLERTSFDELRRIRELPSWAALQEAFLQNAPEPVADDSEPMAVDEMRRRWRDEVTHSRPAAPLKLFTYGELAEPCTGCEAWCCTTLTFPHPVPRNHRGFDFIKFCLGFPGLELGISDQEWNLIVKTRCRHLDGNRCGIYGKPERPLVCRYYDANQCWYRASFGVTRPPHYLRIGHEEFELLTDCFRFNEQGEVIQVSNTAGIRSYVEARLRAGA